MVKEWHKAIEVESDSMSSIGRYHVWQYKYASKF